MVSVLLTLLKIIGIVLLSLLGLLLVLLLIVLFVPVRYRLKGYYKDEFVCNLKATWLLHLVSFSLDYEKELITSIKILGMDISSFINKKENTSSKSKNWKPESNIQSEDKSSSNANSAQTENVPVEHSKYSNKDSAEPNKETSDTGSNTSSNVFQSLFQKIRDFIINIKNKVLSLWHKISETIQNIKKKKESVERYIQILQREEVKSAFSLCKKRIFKIVRHILPKNMKVHAHIGMEDPATTGYIAAFYNILPDKLQRQIILQVYFDKVILEADFTAKGSCNAIRFVHEILCIITDKNCRSFYQLVKKEISNERN